jgi:lipid-A-disaccharide synthase
MKKSFTVFLIAGEPSGDFLGASLMSALKKTGHHFNFQGIGGAKMTKEGLQEVLPFDGLSLMGFFQGITKFFHLYRYSRLLRKKILEEKPDLLITIDFPGFNFYLGKKLKGSGIRHIHYSAPTVWAWRPWRAKSISRFLDHLLTLYPFEPPYFEKHGLDTTFVGHPLMEGRKKTKVDIEYFKNKHNIKDGIDVMLLLPGSRKSELEKHVPIFQETTRLLKEQRKKIHWIIPTLDTVKDMIPEEGWGGDITMITTEQDKAAAYALSKGALAASGTIALELALARVPMIIAYKVGAVTAAIVRLLIKTPYVCMVNILLKRGIIPEMLQRECKPILLAQKIQMLLANERAREKQLHAFDRVEKLLKPEDKAPSECAATVVMTLLGEG